MLSTYWKPLICPFSFWHPVQESLWPEQPRRLPQALLSRSQTFSGILTEAGVPALSAGAMIHAGATVIDSLPHGSFFHATGGARRHGDQRKDETDSLRGMCRTHKHGGIRNHVSCILNSKQNILLLFSGCSICCKVFKQIGNGISFALELACVKRNTACGLGPDPVSVIDIIGTESAFFLSLP